MEKRINKLFVILLVIIVSFAPIPYNYINTITVEAHSGRTDSSGGHKDNKNKSGLGSYHYHCGGNPAHLHDNGVCPYSADSSKKSASTNSSKEKKSTVSAEVVQKVQEALNALGYDCGTPDGVFGKNTKAALKEFQEDNGLKKDGKIGPKVKKALDIS
jgi:hypothetical protein